MDEPMDNDLTSHRLISSQRVEGTPVFGKTGEKLGRIHSVMIDKSSGQVVYAVLAFGGFLHLGEHVHPVPWEKLAYDPELRGYIVDVSPEDLKGAPFRTLDSADRPQTEVQQKEVYDYYALRPWDL